MGQEAVPLSGTPGHRWAQRKTITSNY